MNQVFDKREEAMYKPLFKVYPKSTSSEEESSVFFRKVFGAAVSHITYLRGIFPDYLYQSRYVQDINIKILHENKLYPSANKLIQQIDGIFHAFQGKYLEQAILGFHTVNEETVPIEAYIFKFQYSKTDSKRISLSSLHKSKGFCINKASTVDSTEQLFNQIILITNAMGPLPRKVVIRWKLLYFDKFTPKEYEPPGFKSASGYIPVIRGDHLGHIVSPFHQVLCDMGIDNEKNLSEARSSESIVTNFVTDDSWPTSF